MKKLITLLLAFAMLFTLAACGKEEVAPEVPDVQMELDRPEPEVVEEPKILNPLTGEEVTEEVRARRPYAIMLNNLSAALPQHGNSQADIIFEGGLHSGKALVSVCCVLDSLAHIQGKFMISSSHKTVIFIGKTLSSVQIGIRNKVNHVSGIDNGDILLPGQLLTCCKHG